VISRRVFLTGTATILAAPLVAGAQQAGKVYRIGVLHVGVDHVPPHLDGLRAGLRDLGYDVDTSPAPRQSTVFEGKNLRLDWRNLWDEDAARVAARELVRDRVDLIVAVEDQTIRPAMTATSDIPNVFASSADPVGDGIVKSLSRPGGNVTGIGDFWGGLLAKRLELFKEVVPGLRRVLLLTDANDPRTGRLLGEARDACAKLKLQSIEREVANQFDIDRIFGTLKRGDVDGVTIVSPSLQSPFASLILRLAFERWLPVPIQGRNWVGQGALFSYAPDYIAIGRDAAKYVDRILKGTKPADLPVEQASRLEFVINLKTAKALGLTVPPAVLARADEVIE
jgi:putative ABC transport system substrate-binding protein